MRKGSIAMLALAMIIAGMGKAGEPGKVTLSKEVYEVGEKGATVTVTDGTGGYKAGAGKGFGKVDASFTGKGTHPITISNKPSEEPGDSGVTVTYPAPKSGEEEKSVTAKCTVAKLLNIMGILGGDFNCFAGFDHFYAGNLGTANELELRLDYRPDDLLYTDLPADWTLEGKGTLPYSKDAAEPKWKGKVPLNDESFGTVDFIAKWGTMEVSKSFTRFKLGIVRDEGEHDLWVLKDKSRRTSAKYFTKVLPDSMNQKFYEKKFDWTAFPSSKIKTNTSGDRNEFCTVTPQGYHRHQTSRKEDDVQLIVSWKCPSGSPNPYHTATKIETLTVRTPVYIVPIKAIDYTPQNWAGHKKIIIWYAFLDNLRKRVPGKVMAGLYVNEEWPTPIQYTPFREEGGTYIPSNGVFYDRIEGFFFAVGIYVGTQRLICDHIDGTHNVTIDLTTSPATINATNVVAPTY